MDFTQCDQEVLNSTERMWLGDILSKTQKEKKNISREERVLYWSINKLNLENRT